MAVLGLDLKRRYIRAFPLHCRLKLILHASDVARQKLICATSCKIEFVLDAKQLLLVLHSKIANPMMALTRLQPQLNCIFKTIPLLLPFL